jgi:integrase
MTPASFAEVVEEYLRFRRGLGFELETPAWMLRDFARYADGLEHQGPLTIDLAVQWARSGCSGSPAQASRRLGAVRAFARYQAGFDPATEVPPVGMLGFVHQRRKQPHIYSDAEIAALLQHARLLRPRGGLRPRTYVAFFSLLVSTGLRLSEARRLVPSDVDLVDGVVTIRESKFRKSRLVPLHPTTMEALSRYAAHRGAFGPGCFFRTDRAPALSRAAVGTTFRRLRQRLDWIAEGRARHPRIHDLRHTFAVRRLLSWYREGVNVDRKILALATYMGHAKVTYTYWYLSAVPELMAITSQRFEQFAKANTRSAS